MKDVCREVGMSYETLKFYCNQGLVPNVRRDANNHRRFDDRDVAWLKSLICLKRCGMSLQEMKEYMDLCRQGPSTIVQRKAVLARRRQALLQSISVLNDSVAYIDHKQQYYDDVLAGRTAYTSNLYQPDGE